jgi:ubiquinone/menaquinone biosynthesis C-methylase UbiE
MKITLSTKPRTMQCQKPTGWIGRIVLRNMNSRHSSVTDWGLAQLSIASDFKILDVGCGGGRTVGKLAALADYGKVIGLDFSKESVKVASKLNKRYIKEGRVEIVEASVSRIPFAANTFDLATAVETHFWWPDLPADLREVSRILKPGGTLAMIAEVYKGANTKVARLVENYLPMTGMRFLSPEEHRDLLVTAGYTSVQVAVDSQKGWILVTGRGPGAPE